MGAWVHLIFEGFCMYQSGKDRFTEIFRFKENEQGEWIKDKKGCYIFESCGRHKNEAFIPGGRKRRPAWCKRKWGEDRNDKITPHPKCEYDSCPFLALAEVSEGEYKVMIKAWEDASKEGKFKYLEEGLDDSVSTPHAKKE